MDTLRESEAGENHPGLVGAKVDRFVIVEKLGAGGMGEVFLARDPQLNRQVALKLLKRSPTDDAEAITRLLSEARAMAQVSHPNVVSVFDAGMHGEQPWVAMELIRGRTLRDWLATSHLWPQTLALLVSVGRGLQAAHDAGLVHRDLKPENILVGDTGRIAVTDFGLAHGAWAETVKPELATPALPQRTGRVSVLIGTPGYMAPEQLRREPTDARTDQFAYATTAYEALYGALPFEGQSELPKPPPPTKVPARVWRALERALQPEQKDRFPNMAGLLAELEGTLPKAGNRTAALLGAGAVVLLAAGGTFVATRPQPCDSGPKLVAPIWNARRRTEVQGALQSSPAGQAVAPKLLEQLDAWVQRWTAMEQQSCEATRSGSQSPALLDLRTACLRQRLGDLDAVVSLLAAQGGALAVKADSAVAALIGVEGCADANTLGGRLPVPRASVAAVEGLEKNLSKVKAMEDLGQYRDALAPATELVTQARALGYPPALAEAQVELARTEHLSGKTLEAEATYEEAVNTAEVARDDRLRARARMQRVQLLISLRKLPDAERELKASAAVVQRVDTPTLNRQLKTLQAELATAQGRLDDAVKLSAEAVEIVERAVPVDERQLVAAIGIHAFSLLKLARFADAAKQYERAIPIADRVLGPNNPGLAKLLGEYAAAFGKLRKLDLARPPHERARKILTESLGDSPLLGDDYYNWGITLLLNHDLDGARVELEHALELRKRILPEGHPGIAGAINSLAVLAVENGKYDEAAEHFKEAVAIREKALGPTHPQVLNDLNDLAGAYSLGGHHAEALATFDQIFERQKAATGSRASDAGHATMVMGRAEELAFLFRFPEARAGLVESHDAALKSEGPDIVARQLLLEAMVAWDGFGEREAATALAKQAQKPVEDVKDPEMVKTLAGLNERIKSGKRRNK